jgi:Arc/MetJ-type ribon-helix-helix transcriptional regulator
MAVINRTKRYAARSDEARKALQKQISDYARKHWDNIERQEHLAKLGPIERIERVVDRVTNDVRSPELPDGLKFLL